MRLIRDIFHDAKFAFKCKKKKKTQDNSANNHEYKIPRLARSKDD